MKTDKDGAAVLIFKDNQVLLVKHGPKAHHVNNVYGLPCGTIEPGENIKATAVRELKEETGLITKEDDLAVFPNNYFVSQIKYKDGILRTMSMTVFVCTKYSGILQNSQETIPEWVDISRLDKLDLLPNVTEAITLGGKIL